jgi:hypothetical protein
MKENTINAEHAEKRYLNSWNYHAALILTELENIVINKGGAICSTWEYQNPPAWLTERKTYLIENRSLSEGIHKQHELLTRLEKLGRTEAATEARKKLNQLEAIKSDPILSYYGDYLYITFTLNSNYYYFSMDNNPFFDFHFGKIKIEQGNKINRNYYLHIDAKNWWNDSFWRLDCHESDIKEASNFIYNMLINADYCKTYTTKNRKPYTNIIYKEVINND